MTGSQFEGWIGYYAVEPFGEYRHELRNGVLCHTLTQIFAPGAKLKPADFMRFREDDLAPTLSRAEIATRTRALFKGLQRKPAKPRTRNRKR